MNKVAGFALYLFAVAYTKVQAAAFAAQMQMVDAMAHGEALANRAIGATVTFVAHFVTGHEKVASSAGKVAGGLAGCWRTVLSWFGIWL